ncbi:alpha/beta fold hydrolase [Nocardioides sp. TF02-7]|uniref:alpha/beta hydrolase family protein n=1 Tax=Nocardioides sp. TF02-7 TaxID=2917724 RepID=UPI001F053B2B|nr:alpha/beta fold hydrolase [Nocardioides sp. TF02-7]UMG94328.1 alpha/beta fold hydrolase [Nocardioides sp. TF02-7]
MEYDTRHSSAVADDGRALAYVTLEPAGTPRGVVLVVPAMATPSTYYAPFARHLAGRGWRVVTFDYRGTESRAAMKASTADVDRWFADVRVLLDAVADEAGDLPVTWVGHSLGGQMLPFVDHTRLASVVTVAAGDGYWRRNAPRVRWLAPLIWLALAPVATRVAGYYPGSRLRVIGDLPAGVVRQWGRWCLHDGYLEVDHPEAPALYAEVKAPLMSLSFTDDELMSAASIERLHDRYTGAEQVRQRFGPHQLDGRRMGHHGFFRSAHADLWEELVEPWLAR